MTNQERAKAAVALFPKIESALYSGDNLSNGEVASIVATLDLLRPIAAGKSVIVPIEPNEVVIDAMRDARRNCSTSRIGGQTIEASYKTEMIVEFSMYAAMIKASQEGE